MNVLLLFANTLSGRTVRKTSSARIGILPPLGLGYIAAVLQQAGHQVCIIDTRIDPITPDVEEQIRRFAPGIVGISIFVISELEGYRLAERMKKVLPHVPVVMGGPHVTYFPKAPLERCASVDMTVQGEGEYIMRDLVQALEVGDDYREVKNVYYRQDNGSIKHTGGLESVPDIEGLPLPSRELFNLNRYAPEVYEFTTLPATNILATRGCAYGQCTFCFESGKFRTKYRYRSADNLIAEVEMLRDKYGIQEIVFNDDDLLSNGKLLMEFSRLAIERKLGMRWSCWGRVTPCTKNLLDTIAKAGCWLVSFGIESGNQDLLDRLQKGMTLEKCRQVVKWCQEAGLEVMGTFMLALPGETPEKAERTIDFAIELDLTYAAFIPTHPLFGTPLFETCIEEGKMVKSPYLNRPVETRYLPRISYVPDGYEDQDAIERILRRAYRRFYFRPKYVAKHLRKLASLTSMRRYYLGLQFALSLMTRWGDRSEARYAVRYSILPEYSDESEPKLVTTITPLR
jgi:radical SAM superfamily enzyme YgiQ (UPF0313 family)